MSKVIILNRQDDNDSAFILWMIVQRMIVKTNIKIVFHIVKKIVLSTLVSSSSQQFVPYDSYIDLSIVKIQKPLTRGSSPGNSC